MRALDWLLLGLFLGIWGTATVAQIALEQQAIDYEIEKINARVLAEAYPKRRKARPW